MNRILIGVMAVILIVTGCTKSASEDETISIEEKIAVSTVKVENTTIYDTFLSIGKIEAAKSIEVNTGGSGRVVKINVSPGDEVKEGDVLFVLDKETLINSYQATESQLRTLRDNLKINYEDLVESYNEKEELFRQGAIPESELDTIAAQLKQTEKSYEDSKINYDRQVKNLKKGLEDRNVKSPIDGKVAVVLVEEDEEVINEKAIEVINEEQMIAKTMIPSKYFNGIKLGGETIVYPDAEKEDAISGKIMSYNKSPDASNGLYEVKISLEKTDRRFRSGEYAEIEFIIDEREALTVPRKSVIRVGGEYVVYSIKGDYAQEKKVEIGKIQGDRVEVNKGIELGEEIVVRGQNYLSDGTRIAYKK